MGGRRPGAGRKKGSGNKMSAAARAAAAATGILPHEFLLIVMRGGEAAKQLLGAEPTQAERIDCAKNAAPYYAPRLQTIQGTGDGGAHVHKLIFESADSQA